MLGLGFRVRVFLGLGLVVVLYGSGFLGCGDFLRLGLARFA